MAGRPGRSGGHNKLSPEAHLLRGTWNVTRHGPRPAALPRVVAPPAAVDPIPPAVVEGLTGRGLDFAQDSWRTHRGWTPASLVLLREIGFTMTWLEQHRGEKGERQAQRLLVQLLNALDLEK